MRQFLDEPSPTSSTATNVDSWYSRDEEGPWSQCKRCYWGVPIRREAIVTQKMVILKMAYELEQLLAT